MDLSCEITRTCARVFHLTTGTFNLIVKDRIAFRLSGAPSVQNGVTQVRIRLSSKPFKHIALSCCCQPIVPTGFPPVFHNWGATTDSKGSSLARNETRLPLATQLFSAQAEAEDYKLEKRPIGGSCDER